MDLSLLKIQFLVFLQFSVILTGLNGNTMGEYVSNLTKSSRKKGLAPGTPVYVGESVPEKTVISLTQYNAETLETSNIAELNILFEKLTRSDDCQWVNVVGLADVTTITRLCEFFNVHPLVIEDILNTTQLPKIDYYDDYTQISCKVRQAVLDHSEIVFSQMSLLLIRNVVITFQEKEGDFFNTIKERLANPNSRARKLPSDYLGYLFIDFIVDDYLYFLEETGDKFERLEDLLVAESKKFSLKKLYLLRRQVSAIRKVIQPLCDNINKVVKSELAFVDERVKIYFRDLSDHCLRALQSVDTYREMVSGMLDIYLSQLNNKTNQTMRVLTIFASIFIPLTFISSIYGMNFVNMPELKSPYGYYIVLSVMGVVAVSLLAVFRKKKWI